MLCFSGLKTTSFIYKNTCALHKRVCVLSVGNWGVNKLIISLKIQACLYVSQLLQLCLKQEKYCSNNK